MTKGADNFALSLPTEGGALALWLVRSTLERVVRVVYKFFSSQSFVKNRLLWDPYAHRF